MKYYINLLIIILVLSGCSLTNPAQKEAAPTPTNNSNNTNASIEDPPTLGKPVLYLYPSQTQAVQVRLDIPGQLIASYPTYNIAKGWNVTAQPDGTIYNREDNQEYSYLFWEADTYEQIPFNLSTGFVVKGEDTQTFLQDILPQIGLTPKEYNEFIVYWYPILQNNPYNLIHFSTEEYNKAVPLTITPQPDSVLRVLMVYKPLNAPIEIQPQTFTQFERVGFTVVEWGGTEYIAQ